MAANQPTQVTFNLAKSAFSRADYQQALELIDQVSRQDARRPEFINLKALTLMAMNRPEPALELINTVIKKQPASAGLLLNAARICLASGRFKSASQRASEAVRAGDDNPALLHQAARIFRDTRQYDRALQVMDRCVKANPGFAEGWHLKGSMEVDLGDWASATQSLIKAVSLDKQNARALSALVKIKPDLANDPSVQKLLHSMQQASDSDTRATALFARANMLKARDEHEQAFLLFQDANRIIDEHHQFDLPGWQQKIESTISATAQSVPATAQAQSPSCKSLLIVGMPRSGTSLLEQVLSAHSAILGCGELTALDTIEAVLRQRGLDTDRILRANAKERLHLDQAAQWYRDALPTNRTSYRWVTDKAPMNFERVGLINQIDPSARFIHSVRHPLDIIVSCYFQNFQAGLNWAFNLETITAVYISQARLMDHWKARMGSLIHTVEYQQVVDNLESTAKTLADGLELEFEASMLKPHEQKRAVATASNTQVRQPLYRSSIGYWKQYESFLSKPIAMLSREGLI